MSHLICEGPNFLFSIPLVFLMHTGQNFLSLMIWKYASSSFLWTRLPKAAEARCHVSPEEMNGTAEDHQGNDGILLLSKSIVWDRNRVGDFPSIPIIRTRKKN